MVQVLFECYNELVWSTEESEVEGQVDALSSFDTNQLSLLL